MPAGLSVSAGARIHARTIGTSSHRRKKAALRGRPWRSRAELPANVLQQFKRQVQRQRHGVREVAVDGWLHQLVALGRGVVVRYRRTGLVWIWCEHRHALL